jgi:hypothetical protein
MRRRTLLTVTAVTAPAALLSGLDEALASVPMASASRGSDLDTRLAGARALYDTGAHTRLLAALPALIADGHAAAAPPRRDLDQARLSCVYSLATAVLSKLGAYPRARLTADRATTWAEVSGSPLAAAAAARELAIVLRHQDQPAQAQRLMLSAAADMEATGLRTGASASAYAQMLCTLAYTAARAGQRTEAHTMAEEARRAARRLPATPPPRPPVHPQPGRRRPLHRRHPLGPRRRWRSPGNRQTPPARTLPHLRMQSTPRHRHGTRLVGLEQTRTDSPRPARRLPRQSRGSARPARHPPHRQRTGRTAPPHHRRTGALQRRDTCTWLTPQTSRCPVSSVREGDGRRNPRHSPLRKPPPPATRTRRPLCLVTGPTPVRACEAASLPATNSHRRSHPPRTDQLGTRAKR